MVIVNDLNATIINGGKLSKLWCIENSIKSSIWITNTFCVIRKVQVQQLYYKLIFTLYNMKQT